MQPYDHDQVSDCVAEVLNEEIFPIDIHIFFF